MADNWLGRLYVQSASHQLTVGNVEAARRLFLLALPHLSQNSADRRNLAVSVAHHLTSQPAHVRSKAINAASQVFIAGDVSRETAVVTPIAKDFERVLRVEIHSARAFLALAEGDSRTARLSALKAVALNPSLALNRGMMSIVSGRPFRRARSIRPTPSEGRPTRTESNGRNLDHGGNSPGENGSFAHDVSITDPARPFHLERNNHALPKHVIGEIEEQLDTRLEHIEYLTTGLYTDSAFFKVATQDHRYVVRLVGGKGWRENIPALKAVHAAGVAAPRVYAHDSNQSIWLLEEEIAGQAFIHARLAPDQASACLAQLGESLSRLHQIRTTGFGRVHGDQLTTSYAIFAQWIRERETLVERSCLRGELPEETLPYLAQAARAIRESPLDEPSMCHGDLLGNVFVDGGRLSGILDWDTAAGGDPAFDLATVQAMVQIALPDQHFHARVWEAFCGAYRVDAALCRRIRLYLPLVYAGFLGDEPLSNEDRILADKLQLQLRRSIDQIGHR